MLLIVTAVKQLDNEIVELYSRVETNLLLLYIRCVN